jgi:hypothetical protein
MSASTVSLAMTRTRLRRMGCSFGSGAGLP